MLRNYQKKLINEINTHWGSHKNICLQLPTGAGKTRIFTEIARRHPGKALILAHRREIITQIKKTLGRQYDHITVQSVDKRKLSGDYDLVIVDEAHHVLRKNKWGHALDKITYRIGLFPTATPQRCDKKGLGRHADGVCDFLICGPTVSELISDGYLANYKIYAPPSDFNRSELAVDKSGEFNARQLSKSCIMGDVVEHYLKLGQQKPGVTFAVNIEHAQALAEKYNTAGVSAEILTAKTPLALRLHLLDRFNKNELKQIVNVDILGEGFDAPNIGVVSFARPTMSLALYMQQFGRALRPKSDGSEAIIIDHVGNVHAHGLPESDFIWTLDRLDKTNNSTKSTIKTCIQCFAIVKIGTKICPYCGYEAPAASKELELVGGELQELNYNTPMTKLIQRALGKYAGYLKHLGYADAQIKHDFEKRTKIKWHLACIVPDNQKKRIIDAITIREVR